MKISPIERFWSHVKIINDNDSCWEWRACVKSNGYGHIRVDGKNVHVHKFSYELAHGEIPKGMFVLHSCDNRKCVRPKHLFLGTQKVNIQDMVSKGRDNPLRGENHPKAKITNEAASLIKHSGLSYREEANKWGLSIRMICRIRTGKSWRHIK